MKTFKAVLVGTLALAALVTTAYAATPSAQFRPQAKSTVVPPGLYRGTDRNDVLYGTNAADVLLGRGGNDAIYALRGNDVLRGGYGNDGLRGGKGLDYDLAGPGNDRIWARDNARDQVDGGPGFDEAWVDSVDVVRNVERVHRP